MTKPLIITGINLDKAENLLLVAPASFDDSDCELLAKALRDIAPDVQITILTGGFQVFELGEKADVVEGEIV